MKNRPTKLMVVLPIITDDGVFVAHYSEAGLKELDFPSKISVRRTSPQAATKDSVGRAACRAEAVCISRSSRAATIGTSLPWWPTARSWHRLTESALKHVLAGRNPKALPPLDWAGTTAFQQSVWREMLKIPSGETRSYGELAENIGKSKAVRAVGGACGANPIPVLVPCHRVLAAHGKIGGFGGGLDWKRRLLAREGIVFELFTKATDKARRTELLKRKA